MQSVLIAAATLALLASSVLGKAGICPDPMKRGMGLCTSTCKGDDGCAGYLKCCPNSCKAFTCALPDNLQFDEYPEEKPGRCPPVTRRGICTTTCAADQQCAGSLKCCTNNCGASTCAFPEF